MTEYTVEKRTFTHRVPYSNPRWERIDPLDYPHFCDSDVTVERDFPNTHTGEADVVYGFMTFRREPTAEKVIEAVKAAGLFLPDRAETDTFRENNPIELSQGPIMGICGTEIDGEVGYVSGHVLVGNIGRLRLRDPLNPRMRFLVVHSRTPVTL